MARVIIDGSSTAYGLFATGSNGWADRLKAAYTDATMNNLATWTTVHNFASPNRTIESIAHDAPMYLREYRSMYSSNVAVFQLGMCDARQTLTNPEPEVSARRFWSLMTSLGDVAMLQGFEPIFMGLPPFDESRTNPAGPKGHVYTSARRAEYDALVASYAEQEEFTYIDVAAHFAAHVADPQKLLSFDGLHMGDRGHAIMYSLARQAVDRALTEQAQ